MSRTPTAALSAALLLAVAFGCGGKKTTTGPNPGGTGAGLMSATIDGSPWTAIAVTTSLVSGGRIISGSDVARSVAITFVASGTGPQQTGSTSIVSCIIIIGSQSWQAGLSKGGTGNVTITTLTATRAVGTFVFTAPGSTASTTPATRVVTSGTFDVRL